MILNLQGFEKYITPYFYDLSVRYLSIAYVVMYLKYKVTTLVYIMQNALPIQDTKYKINFK